MAIAAIDRADFAGARTLLDSIDFEAILQVYPTTDWVMFGRAAEARYRYAVTGSEDARAAVLAIVAEMRAKGSLEAIIAPFVAELDL
jgi:hypothetical protein